MLRVLVLNHKEREALVIVKAMRADKVVSDLTRDAVRTRFSSCHANENSLSVTARIYYQSAENERRSPLYVRVTPF